MVREEGKVLYAELPENLRQVIITGHGSISTDALVLLSTYGVDLILIDWKGKVVSRLSAPEMRTVFTRREQYIAYKDSRSGYLAKAFVLAKMKNQKALLGTFAKNRKETDSAAAERITHFKNVIEDLITRLEAFEPASIDTSRPSILGFEGSASSTYWDGIKEVVPEELKFDERSGRGALDPFNSMLNYGYGVLEGETWRAVHYAGLDPYGGFLHADRPGKPSMVLDLMEEFRQQLVDRTVISLASKKVVTSKDFQIEEGFCRLSDEARRALLKELLGKMEEYLAVGEEKMRWCDLILSKSRDVAQYLRGEVNNYNGFYLRW
ncbi:MAG: CRISPR-associated endonuclease Cas1 [Thaumarchaeota archaeon]|nr:CRISPR-associated endonuclease Cas1 [Nitrososphaerota archaeon]MCL5319169.1 CRISPR-associated endonuclease Cas1 [Nitrososphaerota archaeon]